MSLLTNPVRSIRKRFKETTIEPMVQIKGNIDNLRLGRNVVIQYGTVLHLGGLDWCENSGKIIIGENGVISPYCILYGCGPGGISIGRNFDCGPYVGIFSSRTEYESKNRGHIFKPIVIGDNVVIFGHCIISPGVTIEDDAVIAAGSVVNNNIPASCFAGGSPCRVIRHLQTNVVETT